MDSGTKTTVIGTDADEALAVNFRARLGARSIQGLRQEMAERGITIGSGAIHAAKMGSRGVRLETLQKFADFFGCSVLDLLRSPASVEATWPFKRLDPTGFAKVNDEVKAAAEDMLISASKRAKSS